MAELHLSLILREALVRDEGDKRFPYRDTEGHLTIGIGRNLDAIGVLPDERDLMYNNDARFAEILARQMFPKFDGLGPVRQAVVCNMAFNMGPRFKGFVKFTAAVNREAWEEAAVQMLDSRWAAQVGDRAKRLAYSMRTNKL